MANATPKMDTKAANEGDKLKHALLLEVVGRCTAWESLTYAETHAGAGIYHSADQDAEKPHIARLHELVASVAAEPAEQTAGGRYFRLLRKWWACNERRDSYPGSILQVVQFLSARNINAQFRVVEAHKPTFDRLAMGLQAYAVIPQHDKFQNRIAWLTENDRLVLLIDPLSFQEDFDEDRDPRLNDGGIDIPTIATLLEPCWRKRSAMVLFWCGFGHARGRVKKGIAYGWLKCICEQNNAGLRCFRDSRCHNLFVIGIGQGKDIAGQLGELDWPNSWLAKTVRGGLGG